MSTTPEEAALPLAEQQHDARTFLAHLAERRPVVTWAVGAVSVVLFALQWLWGDGQPFLSAVRMGGAMRSLLLEGEVWRLLTPMLLHGSPIHLVMNLLALFSFGTFLEQLLGWRRYFLLYVLSGLGGSLASALRPSDVLSVGASGGIWGLMLAGAVLVTWPRGTLPDLVSRHQRQRAWTPVLINAAFSLTPGIDLLAHFGGGLLGGLLMFSGLMTRGIPQPREFGDPLRPPRRESVLVNAFTALGLVALVGSLVAALVTGRPWELRSTPQLHQVSFPGGTLQLPTLVGPMEQSADATWVFGSLRMDPMLVMVFVPKEVLSPEQVQDPEAELLAPLATSPPKPLEGFSYTIPGEVRHTPSGRPYLFSRQTSEDGRRGDSYLLVEGRRSAQVMVLTSETTSQTWRTVAEQVPFSLKL